MLTFFSSSIDFENLNLDDEKTYELFQNSDTDGIYMMESEWGSPSGIRLLTN